MAKVLSYGDEGDITTFIFDGERLIILNDPVRNRPELVMDTVLGPKIMKELAEALFAEADALEAQEALDDKAGAAGKAG